MNLCCLNLVAGAATLALLGLRFPAIAADPVSSSNRPAGRAAPNGGALSLDQLFATLDQDGDGRISRAEATGGYAQRFSQWDADGDGFATRQEIHAFRVQLGIDDSGARTTSGNASAASAPRNKGKGAPRSAATAVVLKEPADWRLETMPVPTGFAPDIAFAGTEEIRFAPGMFDPASDTYFTCALALVVDDEGAIGAPELQEFLEKYYSGLSVNVGRSKGLSPKRAEMRATVKPASDATENNRFEAEVVFFDTFSDGRKIKLNVEARILSRTALKKTVIILLVAPSAKDKSVWETLRGIGDKAARNAR